MSRITTPHRGLRPRAWESLSAGGEAPSIGIFAGLQGGAVSGMQAARILGRQMIACSSLHPGISAEIHPCCNPRAHATRSTELDLNTQFWRNSEVPEVQYLETILRDTNFDIIINLVESNVTGGIALPGPMSEGVLRAMLAATRGMLGTHGTTSKPDAPTVPSAPPSGILSAPPWKPWPTAQVVFAVTRDAPPSLQVKIYLEALHRAMECCTKVRAIQRAA